MGTSSRTYGVKLVRGPFVRLPPHGEHCKDEAALAAHVRRIRDGNPDALVAADLFSGAGGLSLGLKQAGIQVVLSVDHDADAVETHAHHFGGLSVNWDLSLADQVERVAQLVSSLGIDVLAGGPPCQPFSKAGRSGIRHRVRSGLRDPHDQRRDLWRSYIEVVRLSRPRAVLMENVPDMALDREMFILRSVVEELEQLGYSVDHRVVDSWRYGVPQFRQRLIVAAIRDGGGFAWPEESPDKVNVWNAIGDLPPVEGGWRPEGGEHGWAEYEGPLTSYQRLMRDGVSPPQAHKVFDHITRPVREDDARAFDVMDHQTRYSQLPEEVRRYRDDIFDDKYKRLNEDDVSRTITAHIAKDGYWYIHPRQGRTITIREAARLQSFPDWYRFAGPPSAAFRQIGNAVPPLLGQRLGEAVREALTGAATAPPPARATGGVLADWFHGRQNLTLPWLRARTRWTVVTAETVLDRLPLDQAKLVWPAISQWSTPEEALAAREELLEVASWVQREERAGRLLEMAEQLSATPGALEHGDVDAARECKVPEAVLDLAILAVPASTPEASEEPVLVTKGVLRVAARFTGLAVDRTNRLTDGRLAVARMIGGSDASREAHVGLVELAAAVCVPGTPDCPACPLKTTCVTGRNRLPAG